MNDRPIDPHSPEARRAADFAQEAMAALNPTPSRSHLAGAPLVTFPTIEAILAGLPELPLESDPGEGNASSSLDQLSRLARPGSTGDRPVASEFELRRELREIETGIDPEVSRSRLEQRLGRDLGELLREGIKRPAIFDAHPNGRNAFRAVFGRPEALPSIPAVKEFLESSETRAPGWLWARVQAELETGRNAATELPTSWSPISWKLWGAVAALFLAAAWVWSFAGGPIPFESSDPWTVRERDDSANTGGPRFVEAARPFTNFRSMASIVEDIQDGTPR